MALTAGDIIKRIRDHVGASWLAPTSEGFECGSESVTVNGIVTAWTPTIDAINKAVSLKANFMISVEPPYWHEFGSIKTEVSYGRPTPEALNANPVYQSKKKLIDSNNLVIWRFNENFKALPDNPRLNALAASLHWKGREDAAATKKLAGIQAGVYAIPETSFLNLAKQAKDLVGAKALRAVGDPKASIRRVALLPGYMTNERMMAMVHDRNVDVVISGDACQWESFEYAEDWIDASWGKGLILLGQAASESPGGKEMANWLQSFIKDVPVTGFACGELYDFVLAQGA
jgi:putative NIF3 family GTP cyclohydrolase 1 type 2